jgi:hypothetical protein
MKDIRDALAFVGAFAVGIIIGAQLLRKQPTRQNPVAVLTTTPSIVESKTDPEDWHKLPWHAHFSEN